LAFDYAARPQSAEDLVLALRDSLTFWRRQRRWTRSHRKLTALGLMGAATLTFAVASSVLLQPAPAVRRLQAAQTSFIADNFADAIEQADRAIASDKSLADAYILRARALQQSDNFDAALNDYRAAYQLRPSSRLLAAMGYCAESTKKWDAAIELYERSRAAGFESATIYNNLGHCFLKMGKIAKAAIYLEKAIDLDDSLQAPFINRVSLALNKLPALAESDVRDALANADRALQRGPGSAELFLQIAALCSLLPPDDPATRKDAVRYLRQAVAAGYEPVWIDRNPLFAGLRDRQDYKDLAQVPLLRGTIKNSVAQLNPYPADPTTAQ
jgi:tetratricopeptide (TPR) repeat protein